jgi:hypothetical protein
MTILLVKVASKMKNKRNLLLKVSALLSSGIFVLTLAYLFIRDVDKVVSSSSERVRKSESKKNIKRKPASLTPKVHRVHHEDQKRIKTPTLSNNIDLNQIDIIEEKWHSKMMSFFLNDLKLTENDFKTYLKMRDSYEEERYNSYQKFHQLKAKENKKYALTAENEANDSLIENYQLQFKKRFGDRAYAFYTQALDDFNSQLRMDRSKEIAILSIDF